MLINIKVVSMLIMAILCLSMPIIAEATYEIIQIEHTDAAEIAKIIVPQFPNLTITVAGNKNALVVSGPSSEIARLKSILPFLDVAPQQVKITAKLSELSEKAVKDLGIEWPGAVSTTLVEKEGSNTAFRAFSRSNIVIPATIHFLEQKGEMSTTETATISILTGNTGVIRFQKLIPITVLKGRTPYGDIVEGSALLPVGLELIVYPRVFPDNKIQLKIIPSTGEVTGATPSGSSVPIVKGASTEIMARSGETVVIGSVDQSQMGVLRSSGGNTRKQTGKTHLVILVTSELLGK